MYGEKHDGGFDAVLCMLGECTQTISMFPSFSGSDYLGLTLQAGFKNRWSNATLMYNRTQAVGWL